MKKIFKLSVLVLLAVLTSCGNSVSTVTAGGTPSAPIYGQYNSPDIMAKDFINALNSIDGVNSFRVNTPNQFDHSYIVFWDDKEGHYEAVDINFLRKIVYYDFYSNNSAVAVEFRKIKLGAGPDGSYGDDHKIDFEAVEDQFVYHSDTNEWVFGYVGKKSGTLYEDEPSITDVSLMARESENDKFIKKAANVSMAFQVSIETSLSMVTLGAKMEKMLSRNSGELTAEDSASLMTDMQSLTGVSLAEIQAAAQNSDKKEEVLKKIAKKLGTSTQNLEDKLLPGVFGITL